MKKRNQPETNDCDLGNLIYAIICFSPLTIPFLAVLENKSETFASILRIFVPY